MTSIIHTDNNPPAPSFTGGRRTGRSRPEYIFTPPLVSIITVVFNGEKTLAKTIQSIRQQTYQNIEYIVIDGGSSDGTLDILRAHDTQIDYWISERDTGIYDAMNKGIALAHGEIIGILNSDDRYLPHAVAKAVEALLGSKASAYCYGSLVPVDSHGYRLGIIRPVALHLLDRRILRETAIPHPTMFVRASIYRQYGGFDAKLRLAGDFELIARLHQHGLKGIEIKEMMVEYQLGGASSNPLILREKRLVAITKGLHPTLAWLDWLLSMLAIHTKKILSPRLVEKLRTAKYLLRE